MRASNLRAIATICSGAGIKFLGFVLYVIIIRIHGSRNSGFRMLQKNYATDLVIAIFRMQPQIVNWAFGVLMNRIQIVIANNSPLACLPLYQCFLHIFTQSTEEYLLNICRTYEDIW